MRGLDLLVRIDLLNQHMLLSWQPWRHGEIANRYARLIRWAEVRKLADAKHLLALGWLALEAG